MGECKIEIMRDALSQRDINMRYPDRPHPLPNIRAGDFYLCPKAERDNMLLFYRRLTEPEQARMRAIFTERGAAARGFYCHPHVPGMIRKPPQRRYVRFAASCH